MKTTVIYDPTFISTETITCNITLVLSRGESEIETPTSQIGLSQLCMRVHEGIVEAIQGNYDATYIKSLETKADLVNESDSKKRRSSTRSKRK